MITKLLSKIKSILFKSSASSETPLKKAKKSTKASISPKTKSKKGNSKKGNSKKVIETLTALPGVGAKSAKAFYEAGFKTKESITAANEKDLLAIPGVGINLVKKLKKLK